MSALKRLLPALALILAAGACENDTEPENELSMEESVALLTAAGSIVGGLNWELGERSGDCDLALTLEAVPDLVNETLTGVYRGTLCGHEVEIDANDLLVVDL